MMAKGRLSDQRGLMGKILIVWLLILALFVVASIDTISILYSRFKVADAAQSAAFDAASAYKTTHSRTEAEKAAFAAIRATAPGARLVSLVIDPATGDVTLTVAKKVGTILVGRIGFLRHLTRASSTETSSPPSL
jgi:Tfp pilus assembly protein PilX